MNPQTVAEALVAGQSRLRSAGVPDPSRDARRLLAHALGTEPGRITLIAAESMPQAAAASFSSHIDARIDRVPVSRIIGRRAFYGRSFEITADVLDPRPETETLIELALAEPFGTVLDLGTGSGCIALTLLAERPSARAVATDISVPALEQAAANASALGVTDRVEFAASDWFAGVKGRFDLIVSNPPYIAVEELADLSPEVSGHDPRQALTDGRDGLTGYRHISTTAARYLSPGGRVLVEIGAGQGTSVPALFRAAGWPNVQVHHDLDGRDRVVSARLAD